MGSVGMSCDTCFFLFCFFRLQQHLSVIDKLVVGTCFSGCCHCSEVSSDQMDCMPVQQKEPLWISVGSSYLKCRSS